MSQFVAISGDAVGTPISPYTTASRKGQTIVDYLKVDGTGVIDSVTFTFSYTDPGPPSTLIETDVTLSAGSTKLTVNDGGVLKLGDTTTTPAVGTVSIATVGQNKLKTI